MEEDNPGPWVNSARWRERWEVEENLPGGGQGDAFRASRKSDRQVAFLKTIRARTPERRARFFREANAYDTFRVAGVPDLIESNAHQHKDASFEPYIATRFIEGPTLRAGLRRFEGRRHNNPFASSRSKRMSSRRLRAP
jgi:eukaryotic-like serine/threonine-protein kinase